jgi:hypothetical protein
MASLTPSGGTVKVSESMTAPLQQCQAADILANNGAPQD